MTLRTNGLDWLAQNAGSGNCFTPSGVSYRDADGVSHTGGTKDVVNAFVVANMVGKTTAKIIAGTSYAGVLGTSDVGFKVINDNTDLAIGDVSEAADREADGGTYPRYCYTAGTVCTAGTIRCKNASTIERCKADGSGWEDIQTCGTGYHCDGGVCVAGTAPEKPTTGPMEVYVGGGADCPDGAPSVTVDTTEAFAFFKSEAHDYIGVGGIKVHNLNTECRAHFIWEARVWDGYGYTTCPITEPEMQEINRYLMEAGSRPLSTTTLTADQTDVVWGSFEILAGMEGEKTVCLSLWGNFDKNALMAELNDEEYYDKI